MKHTKNTVIRESIESRELYLYAVNTRDIYFKYVIPAVKNLAKYYKRGTFDAAKAVDAFFPAACAAAKLYCREFARLEDAPHVFDVTARYTVAANMLSRYMENIEQDDL